MGAIDGAPGRRARSTTAAIAGGLALGRIFHRRSRPRVNQFSYCALYFCLNLKDLDRLSRPLLSLDRFNLVSLYRRDFGPRDGSDLERWMRDILESHGLGQAADGDIVLHGHPRLLGYVFNPVSFWFCHDRAGALRAVLADVSNTFGEHHHYLVAHEDARPIAPTDWLEARKLFHVSPFLPVEGFYRFRFRLDSRRMRADIHYHDAPEGQGLGPMLVTYVDSRRRPLGSLSLLSALLRHPLASLSVVALIHYQAAKIWFKKARFYRKPEPPSRTLSR